MKIFDIIKVKNVNVSMVFRSINYYKNFDNFILYHRYYR